MTTEQEHDSSEIRPMKSVSLMGHKMKTNGNSIERERSSAGLCAGGKPPIIFNQSLLLHD